MDKMRSGVALLITLSIVAAMITLMGVMFGYLNNARQRAELKSSLIEADLLLADLPGQIRQIVGKKPTQGSMYRLSIMPLLSIARNREFSMDTRCSPLSNRANLSWLGNKADKTRSQARADEQRTLVKDIISHLFDTANLKDSPRLYEIITSYTEEKLVRRFGIKGRVNKKKGTISYEDFQNLLDEYYFETGDARAYKLPWKSYFVFGIKTETIDGDFMPAELLAFMYDMEIPEAKEHINANPKKGFKLSSLFDDYPEFKIKYQHIVSTKTVAMARCTTSFKYKNKSHNFKFDYINAKADNFEFLSR